MLIRPDRRTVTGALAAMFAAPPAAQTKDSLAAVIAPADGTPMASAGVIARYGDGSVALSGAVGRAWGPAGPRPFALDQPFRVASVSKMIAASVFVPLALRRGLDLDADASDAVGFRLRHPAWPDTPITVRMLLSHTSGLRNGPSYPIPLGHRLSEAFTPHTRHYDDGGWFGPSEHRPGAWFAYADANFALVAQMLERLSGHRFDVALHEAVFAPLGLDVGYNWSGVSAGKRARAAAAVHPDASGWKTAVDADVLPAPNIALTRPAEGPQLDEADYLVGENGFVFSPQGGLRLSLQDMDVLARMFAAGGRWNSREIVPRPALKLMQRRAWTYDPAHPNGDSDGVFQSYGLGCETPVGRPGPTGDAFLGAGTSDWRGHFGDAYGWITALFWNRRDRRTLVYAINGMPEKDRPAARRSCLTAPEEALIERAFGA